MNLRSYQQEAVDFIRTKKNVLLSLPIGAGKTLASIAAMKEFDCKKVMIVCQVSLKKHWRDEIKQWLGEDVVSVEGSKKKRLEVYSEYVKGNARFLVIGYETLRVDYGLLQHAQFDAIICDEVTKIKNYKTKVNKALAKLSSTYRLALSGNPIEKKLEDLFGIMRFIDPALFGSWWSFRSEFLVFKDIQLGTRSFQKLVGYRNLPKIKWMLNGVMFKKDKADVLPELPSKIEKTFFFDLNQEQRTEYVFLRDSIASNISAGNRANALVQILKLRQLIDMPLLLGYKKPAKKAEVLKDIVSNIDFSQNQVLVFSHFVEPCNMIQKELSSIGVSSQVITGKTPISERGKIIDDFRDKKFNVLVCSEVLSYGQNLQNANIVINYSLPWNVAKFDQMVGRVHRLGQLKTVVVINILAKDTIEEHVLKILMNDSKLINDVLGMKLMNVNLESNLHAVGRLLNEQTSTTHTQM